MKKYLIFLSVIAVMVIGGVVWLKAAPSPTPAPIIGLTKASPTFTTINTPTQITVTSVITDPTVIPTGVNLTRVNDDGKATTVMGQLHDDGRNGDAVAGDKIFSYQFTVNQPTEGMVAMQVSAAFKGVLRRSVSSIVVVAVSQNGVLPPDPGNLGKLTLEGIDADGDGTRDDVQRYIALTYPNSQKSRAALTQETIAKQAAILYAHNDSSKIIIAAQMKAAFDCSIYLSSIGGPNSKDWAALTDQIANTHDRRLAYLAFNDSLGGETFLLTPKNERKSRCIFDPDKMGD